MSPFEWIKAINEKTEAEFDTSYQPFVVNRGLSMHKDTLFWANEMNRLNRLDKEIQFDFYVTGVPKGKRFGKWEKKAEAEDNLLLIQEFYNINTQRASEYLSILTADQIEMIKTYMSKGGKK